MDRDRVSFAAASSRFVIAVLVLGGLPFLLPSMAAHLVLFGAYVVLAAVFQWMIWTRRGGIARTVVSGVIDVAMITFLVQRLGSTVTMVVALYFYASMVNTLVAGRRLGLLLGLLGASAYVSVVTMEWLGVLPFAPDASDWVSGTPSGPEYAVSALMMLAMIVGATSLVGALVAQSDARAQALLLANEKLERLSERDPLTQVYNRRYVMERLGSELARRRRGKPLAVVMIDLDRFKRVNDEEGHQRGDQLLTDLAGALSRSVRETDVVGRYGGDEFVVLLPDTDPEQASVVAGRIVSGVREVGQRFDHERPVTASVGLAVARLDDDARELIQRADRAAYRAKGDGGDRFALGSSGGSDEMDVRIAVESAPPGQAASPDLRDA